MNKDQAAAFVRALNAAHAYVPPILFDPLANSDVTKLILAVANGLMEVDIKSSAASAAGEMQPGTAR